MKVSQKTDYALRAMLELSLRPEQTVRTAEIARNQQIPEKFLELILVELRRAGLIHSQRGPVGGHRLLKEPKDISVGQIWRAVDGSVLERPAQDLGRGGSDPFRSVWDEVDAAVAKVVNQVSLADIRKRAEAKRGVPDYSI
ncbi:MAG TPA: Rrf2 family transcriptional regulator [Planctomycetota bacterium]|nr:Rrf2 family transcriptional regulator [Planctomycetota bacterium]